MKDSTVPEVTDRIRNIVIRCDGLASGMEGEPPGRLQWLESIERRLLQCEADLVTARFGCPPHPYKLIFWNADDELQELTFPSQDKAEEYANRTMPNEPWEVEECR